MYVSERWAPAKGFEGHYEVSDHGRVRSVERFVPRGKGRYPVAGRLLAISLNENGYQVVKFKIAGRTYCKKVHRLVAAAFCDGEAPGLFVCHNDDVPTNNHYANLRWDTPLGNTQDMMQRGRHYEAKRNACARGHKYTAESTLIPAANPKHRICRVCRRERERRAYEVRMRAEVTR